MAARRRLSVLPSCPTVLQSCLGILQFCLSSPAPSALNPHPVVPQSWLSTSISFALLSRNRPRRQRRSLTRPSRDRPRCYRRSPSRPSPDCSAAAAEVSRIFCGICPVEAVCSLQKQKSRHFCNFFAITDSPPSLKSEIGPQHSWITCVFASQSAIGRF